MATTQPADRFVLINTFFPKPGRLDELIETQLRAARELGPISSEFGWRGNLLHRTLDGEKLVIVTAFESAEAQRRWAESEEFKKHRAEIEPLVERVESVPCQMLARHGEV
jgi:heme-degrading monooxygenase HmoA